MADQEFIFTMHTLNKYGVPCVDVTDYPGRSSATSISPGDTPGTFYLQKTPFKYLINTKLLSLGGVIPDPFEPITGVPWVFCYFFNDDDAWGGKGYCSYYSLQSGSLIKTVELPYQVARGSYGLLPAVDINTDHVVYSAVEYEGCPEQYNRFARNPDGSLTMEGRLSLTRGFYYPNAILYIGGENSYTNEPTIPPRDILPGDIDVDTDTFTLNSHGFTDPDMEWIYFMCSGTPPGGLQANHWYVVVETTPNTFKLALNPYDESPWTGTPIDITSQGTGVHTLFVDYGYYAYANTLFFSQTHELRPSNILNGRIYSTPIGEDKQTGACYGEALPDLTADSNQKRRAIEKIDMLVGDLAPGTDYVLAVPMSTILPDDYPDKNVYTFLVNIFNDSVDDGSGKYIIGSGQIQGIHLNGEFFIYLTFDDIRGAQGNQLYQKWYDSAGHFLYAWEYPTFDNNGTEAFYSVSARAYHGSSYFHILSNPITKQSYLRRYNIYTGGYVQHELENPYANTEGVYKLTNRQLIDNKYIMVHTTSGHNVFFDVYTTPSQIVGEVSMDITSEELGFFVIPQIGDDQPANSPVTNTLLQLCNSIRHLHMTWAVNQVQVCQAHADWCTSHAIVAHEGLGIPLNLRERNDAAGIYAGVSENLTIVMASTPEQEETQAYVNWISSPHHLQGIIRGGNKYMSFASSTYPESVTMITVEAGTWNGSEYTTEITYRPVQEYERGKLKLYVQNFIWY